jgi:hypothetical protein
MTVTNRTRKGPPRSNGTEVDDIVRGFLAQQARTAADQQRPLHRGTHARGACVRGTFEVFELSGRFDAGLARRLRQGIFSRPAAYPATIRFANSDPTVNSDWQPDVRGLSFSIELPDTGTPLPRLLRHDWSMQSAPTLPFNDVHAFAVFGRVFSARNEAVGTASLSVEDQAIYALTKRAVLDQQRQPVRPYQQLRYWSNVPFRHGPDDIVKYSASPLGTNHAAPLEVLSPKALVQELRRHVNEDPLMSAFDFGVQFLDLERMTHDGGTRDAAFWIENASVDWPESSSPFHTLARLTLLRGSMLTDGECEALYIDVNEFSAPEHAPVGAINRARRQAELASRQARLHTG